MKINRILLSSLLIIMITTSGCIGISDSDGKKMQNTKTESKEWQDAFQFNNMMYAGYGNDTELNYSSNGTITVVMNMQYYFSSDSSENSGSVKCKHRS